MTLKDAVNNVKLFLKTYDLFDSDRESITKLVESCDKKTESKALKPCKCGTKIKPHCWFSTGDDTHFFKCEECGFRTTAAKTEMQARRNWNSEVEYRCQI